MTRQNATNYSNPVYAYATADGDAFDRLDVAGQGQAMDNHDHSSGNGLAVARLAAGAIADASLSNAKLASDTARANLLTNGGFEIWQRGNGPFTCPGGGAPPYGPDRWVVQLATGAGNVAISREASTIDLKGSYAAKVVYTPGAGDATVLSLQQQINTQTEVIAGIRGMPVSVSFRVNCSAVGRARIFWYDGTGGRNNAPSSNVSANAWETLTLTFTPAAGASAFYIGLDFSQSYGSALTVYVDNATLVVGSVPADYAPLHPADDLARCLRYYEAKAPSSYAYTGQAWNATSAYFPVPHLVRKAVTPTTTVTAAASWNVLSSAGGSIAATSSSVLASNTDHSAIGLVVASGLTGGNAVLAPVTVGGGPGVYIEANP
jgi:hypothetical protein